jgi:hypothetical protein
MACFGYISVNTLHKGHDDDNNNSKSNNNNNTSGQKCHTKGSRKETKIQVFMYRILQMWNMKCMIIPVLIGATGIVTRGLRKNLEAIPGNHSTDSLQKTAILGTSHIIQEVLQSET